MSNHDCPGQRTFLLFAWHARDAAETALDLASNFAFNIQRSGRDDIEDDNHLQRMAQDDQTILATCDATEGGMGLFQVTVARVGLLKDSGNEVDSDYHLVSVTDMACWDLDRKGDVMHPDWARLRVALGAAISQQRLDEAIPSKPPRPSCRL